MSIDDKYGIGAGLTALGLAAGFILLVQLTYDKDKEEAMSKAAAAATMASDSSKGVAKADAAAPEPPPLLYRIMPHRELNKPEAWFDGIVCVLALPTGIFFFIAAIMSGATQQEPDRIEK